ncbi:MAG: BON domain-containing protein [Planctomycetota bacterium]
MAAMLEMNAIMPSQTAGKHPGVVQDDELVSRVRHRLLACGDWSIRALECGVSDGILTLRGLVPSWFHKQVAQETVRSLSGIRSIVNLIAVAPDGDDISTTCPGFGVVCAPSGFRDRVKSAGAASSVSESDGGKIDEKPAGG